MQGGATLVGLAVTKFMRLEQELGSVTAVDNKNVENPMVLYQRRGAIGTGKRDNKIRLVPHNCLGHLDPRGRKCPGRDVSVQPSDDLEDLRRFVDVEGHTQLLMLGSMLQQSARSAKRRRQQCSNLHMPDLQHMQCVVHAGVRPASDQRRAATRHILPFERK